jgi:hypothetical protein
VSGHKPSFCLDVVIILFFPLQQLPAVDEGPFAFGKGGAPFLQGKSSLLILTNFSLGDDLGPDQGLFGSALGQVGVSTRSSAAFPQLPLSSRRQATVLTGGGSASTLCIMSAPG